MQSPRNKLYLAAAGAGKTTFIINEAAANKEKRILITTFTENNEVEIRNKFKQRLGYVPSNVTIQTWFSFLLEHGVRPYQSVLYEDRAAGVQLVNEQSAPKTKDSWEIHYFNKNKDVYSDKLSKLVCKIDGVSKGFVISRLERVFDAIYIDEVQDLIGYDLELVRLLSKSTIELILVGDPRQVTYHTHWETKYKGYKEGKIKEFIETFCKDTFHVDSSSLNGTYRNNASICNLANQLFPEYEQTKSISLHEASEHDGIFFVKERDVETYLEHYSPIQLRDSKRTKVNESYPVYTFGGAKGKTFKRTLIYLTKPLKKWLKDRDFQLEFQSRCKAYVAITRAIHSVGLVIKDRDKIPTSDIRIYDPSGLNLL